MSKRGLTVPHHEKEQINMEISAETRSDIEAGERETTDQYNDRLDKIIGTAQDPPKTSRITVPKEIQAVCKQAVSTSHVQRSSPGRCLNKACKINGVDYELVMTVLSFVEAKFLISPLMLGWRRN